MSFKDLILKLNEIREDGQTIAKNSIYNLLDLQSQAIMPQVDAILAILGPIKDSIPSDPTDADFVDEVLKSVKENIMIIPNKMYNMVLDGINDLFERPPKPSPPSVQSVIKAKQPTEQEKTSEQLTEQTQTSKQKVESVFTKNKEQLPKPVRFMAQHLYNLNRPKSEEPITVDPYNIPRLRWPPFAQMTRQGNPYGGGQSEKKNEIYEKCASLNKLFEQHDIIMQKLVKINRKLNQMK